MSKTSTKKAPPAPRWFADARFGMFIHWGSYAVLGHDEQPLFREFLNPSEYRKLADDFRAQAYDPDAWAAVAKQANMRYMVLTTKHHDGFCLWDTSTTRYNAARTGAGRDLIAPYVSACRKAGLRVGLYFSIPDWNIPAFFAGPDRDPRGFREYVRLTWRQIEELMSSYGRIDLLWFDASAWPGARELRSTELVRMIRSHQPDILINNRLPMPRRGGDWGYETPEQRLGSLSYQPWESCITSTYAGWGYHVCHEDPTMWRSQRALLTMLVTCIARGGNLLLNVGPRADGSLPQPFVDRVRSLGDWLRQNRKAVYGSQPADFDFPRSGVMTRNGNRLYLMILYWPGSELSVQGFNEKVRSARLLVSGRKVSFRQEPHRLILTGLPKRAPDLCTVIELVFDAPPTAHPWAKHRLHNFPMPGLEQWAAL